MTRRSRIRRGGRTTTAQREPTEPLQAGWAGDPDWQLQTTRPPGQRISRPSAAPWRDRQPHLRLSCTPGRATFEDPTACDAMNASGDTRGARNRRLSQHSLRARHRAQDQLSQRARALTKRATLCSTQEKLSQRAQSTMSMNLGGRIEPRLPLNSPKSAELQTTIPESAGASREYLSNEEEWIELHSTPGRLRDRPTTELRACRPQTWELCASQTFRARIKPRPRYIPTQNFPRERGRVPRAFEQWRRVDWAPLNPRAEVRDRPRQRWEPVEGREPENSRHHTAGPENPAIRLNFKVPSDERARGLLNAGR